MSETARQVLIGLIWMGSVCFISGFGLGIAYGERRLWKRLDKTPRKSLMDLI